MKKRIIPFLMLQDEQLNKSIQFDKLTYIGDPIIAMKIFNEKEAEEVCIIDIDPSKKGKPINFPLLKEIASEAFTPLSYGGGIRSIQDAERLLFTGIEKLIINSATFEKNGQFVKELVKEFGSSTIIGSVDYTFIRNKRLVFINGGQTNMHIEAQEHIDNLVQQGVGEVLVNCIDRDGMMGGMDLPFIEQISEKVNTPLIATGGVGKLSDIQDAFRAGADAVAAGSLFVYKGPLKAVLINYPDKDKANEIRNLTHA